MCCSPGVNTKSAPVPRQVRFLLSPSDEPEAADCLALSAASVPALSKHPLGKKMELDVNTFD